MIAFIGKCSVKGCACVYRFDVPSIEKVETRGNRYRYQVKVSIPTYSPNGFSLHCAVHHRPIWFKQIDGKLNPEHVCDSRCMGATGPNCECSCGGANHGKQYCH